MEITKWDLADYIKSEEDIISHLNEAIIENDSELLLYVLGAIARSEGMSKLARRVGVARESLYKSLSPEGNPSFTTVLSVMQNLGLELRVHKQSLS
jgi:probable addiction module antidote protein